VFDEFTELISGSQWSYAVVFAFAFLDALIPVVPSETSVVTAGVLAGAGEMSLLLIILCAASGAILGDNTAYGIGRRWGDRAAERLARGERGGRGLRWAKRELDDRGGQLIIVARFIPGGRTLVTLSAGSLAYPWRRFVGFDAIAGSSWALYAALLGYFGGKAFEQQPWKGLLAAFLIAFAIAGGIELIRYLRKRERV
jgi:membrane protein DedA with SNARE-associated domain